MLRPEGIFGRAVTYLAILALFTAATFWVGEQVPAFYYRHAPTDQFLELKQIDAPDISKSTEEHTVTLKWNSNVNTDALRVTELVLKRADKPDVEAATFQTWRYIREGEMALDISFELPDDIETGSYCYYMMIDLQLPYNVSRQITTSSNEFKITG